MSNIDFQLQYTIIKNQQMLVFDAVSSQLTYHADSAVHGELGA